MKTFLRSLPIALFFLSLISQAQPQRELGSADFEEAKMLFKKMQESPNWKKADSISKSLAPRYAGLIPPAFSNDSLYIPWIKENLYLTKFGSLDEVLALRNEWKKTNVEVHKENSALFELMNKASVEQLKVIYRPFVDSSNEYFYKQQ